MKLHFLTLVLLMSWIPVVHAGPQSANGVTLLWLSASDEQTVVSITAGEAAEIVKQSHGGKVLSVKSSAKNNHTVYLVKVLTDEGVVKTVTVDGNTGSVSE